MSFPCIHFKLVTAGDNFTDKQKMTDKPSLREKITDKVIFIMKR